MGVKALIPTSNIYDYDIDDTLNANGGRVSGKEDKYTAAANINPDSKHKPVVKSVNFCQDIDPSKSHYLQGWWKADDGFCGYAPAALLLKQYTEFIAMFDGARNGREYEPPFGKGTPLRQNDFAGYFPAARPMFNSISAPEQTTVDNTSYIVTVNLPSNDGYSLNITDFDTLKDYYYAALFYRSASDNFLVVAEDTLANTNKIYFEPKNLTRLATYKIYPMLFPRKLSVIQGGGFITEQAYTIPNVSPISVYVTGITVDFGVADGRTWARKYTDSEGNHYVEYNVTIKHDSDSQITINSGNAVLRYAEGGSSIETDNFLTSNTNIPSNTWTLLGEKRGDEGIPISEELYNTPLELYIGIQSNLYGITIEVEEE